MLNPKFSDQLQSENELKVVRNKTRGRRTSVTSVRLLDLSGDGNIDTSIGEFAESRPAMPVSKGSRTSKTSRPPAGAQRKQVGVCQSSFCR